MIDPRLSIVEKRLSEIKRVIAVSGSKGGVGKSTIASLLALLLSKKGHKVGLLDLDFFSPSQHIMLGTKKVSPKEDKGIIAPEIAGISFMSIIHFTGENPVLIRGNDVSNAIIELLAITRWPELDFLIIDMPPGIGDATLDILRLAGNAEFILVTTDSKLSLEGVKKLAIALKELNIPILGIISNMSKRKDRAKEFAVSLGIDFLGMICYDEGLEDAIGKRNKILKTLAAKQLEEIIRSGFIKDKWQSYEKNL